MRKPNRKNILSPTSAKTTNEAGFRKKLKIRRGGKEREENFTEKTKTF